MGDKDERAAMTPRSDVLLRSSSLLPTATWPIAEQGAAALDDNSSNSGELDRVVWVADISRDIFGVDEKLRRRTAFGGKEKGEEEELFCSHIPWNVSDCRGSLQWSRRYKVLLPLNWGARRDFVVMLARDSVDKALVVIRRYRYRYRHRQTTHTPIAPFSEGDGSVDSAFIPFTASWKRRIRALVNLRHEHVSPVTDVFIDEETLELLLVHPYLDGMQPLASLFQEYPHLIYRDLTPSWLTCIVREVIAGVRFLHHHCVVHGALSPWTILLDGDGHALVTGFAVFDACPHPHGVIPVGGTVHPVYMAPEVRRHLSHRHIATKAADAFSIGAITFALTWSRQEVSYVALRKAATGVMRKNPRRRMTLARLDAVLAELASSFDERRHVTQSVERQPQRRAEPPPLETPKQHSQESSTHVVVGILQRGHSPALFRATGLNNWAQRTHTPSRRQKKVTILLQEEHERGCSSRRGGWFLSKWRVAALVAFFCAAASRIRKTRREALAAAASTRRLQSRHGAGPPVVFAASAQRPRRPSLLRRAPSGRGLTASM